MLSRIFSSTVLSANISNVHRALPSGGLLHAIATILASTSPVIFGSTGGFSRALRRRNDSMFAAAKKSRFASLTVYLLTPIILAMSSCRLALRPPDVSNAMMICARLTKCTLCSPPFRNSANSFRCVGFNSILPAFPCGITSFTVSHIQSAL